MEHKFPLPSSQFKNPEEEIAHLRNLIAEKEKHLENLNIKGEDLAEARRTLAQYKVAKTDEVLHPEFKIDSSELDKIVLKLLPEEHTSELQSP
jgi:hypothetical protein